MLWLLAPCLRLTLSFPSLNSSGPSLTKEDARCSPCIDTIPSAATTDKENLVSFPTF